MMRAAFTSAGNIYISEHERNDTKNERSEFEKKDKRRN